MNEIFYGVDFYGLKKMSSDKFFPYISYDSQVSIGLSVSYGLNKLVIKLRQLKRKSRLKKKKF